MLDRHYITVSSYVLGNMCRIAPNKLVIVPHLVCLVVTLTNHLHYK